MAFVINDDKRKSSSTNEGFHEKYEIGAEIAKGGCGIVCKGKKYLEEIKLF